MAQIEVNSSTVEESGHRTGADPGELTTSESKAQIGNNELYWEFIKMKLRMSEIEDSNSKLNKRVDELSTQVETLQTELVNQRQRNEQLYQHKTALDEHSFHKSDDPSHPTTQIHQEDFEKNLDSLEKALNLPGNIQLIQENLMMASAANDKRLILSNIERLKDFLKAKRSLESLHQKKKKKRADKEKRHGTGEHFEGGNTTLDLHLMEQLRKVIKTEGMSPMVFNQVARVFPQVTSTQRFQGQNEQASQNKINEFPRNSYQITQFSAANPSETSSGYYMNLISVNGGKQQQQQPAQQFQNGDSRYNYMMAPAGNNMPSDFSNNQALQHQNVFENVANNSRPGDLLQNVKEGNQSESLEGGYDPSHSHGNQNIFPILSTKSDMSMNMMGRSTKDPATNAGEHLDLYTSKESADKGMPSNYLNQNGFGMGSMHGGVKEMPSLKFSPSMDLGSMLQSSKMPDDNFQLLMSHETALNKASSYLEPMVRAPLNNNSSNDLSTQLFSSDFSHNNPPANSKIDQPANDMNMQTSQQGMFNHSQNVIQEYPHMINQNLHENPLNQYTNYQMPQAGQSGQYNQHLQDGVSNYTM